MVLFKYKPKIVAITGSIGKTSTKDAVYRVVSRVSHIRKSEKSYNSEIGLPLSVLGLPNAWSNPLSWIKNFLRGLWLFLAPHKYPKWLILEVGVSKPGDMRRTASWLHTDAVIITSIGETPSHIEFFDSKKSLIKEKSGLIKTLKKDGLLVLNADDPDVLAMRDGSRRRSVTYGFSSEADVLASAESIFYDEDGAPRGINFRVDAGGHSLPVVIEGAFGGNHIFASLATLALAYGLELNMLDAVNALKDYDAPPGRMRLLDGIKDTLIIDDTYNSSPFACESAIKTLGEIKRVKGARSRKIAILGDMLELGRHTAEAHVKIGAVARENLSGAKDILIVVGPRAEAIGEGALGAGFDPSRLFVFKDAHETAEFIKEEMKEKDLILIKGSQGMRLERVVEAILKDKKNIKKLLVRQDSEWRRKK
jgi:UDP-N-acetylmuramoyl-tripeptide--D-alanyl-D-alanine ligase